MHLLTMAMSPWWTDTLPLSRQQTFVRLPLAMLLGMTIGAERQWRQRAAGLRTNTLVCLGAAAFVDLGLTVAPNTTQVIAYVVSGVGFLGAGAIMKEGANVRGLNTAATLWCSAAVGACIGAGELLDGIFVSLLLLAINSGLRPLSRYIDQRSLATLDTLILYRLQLICETGHAAEARRHLQTAMSTRSIAIRELRTEEDEETKSTMIQAVLESHMLSSGDLQEISAKLKTCPWVRSLDLSGTDPEAE